MPARKFARVKHPAPVAGPSNGGRSGVISQHGASVNTYILRSLRGCRLPTPESVLDYMAEHEHTVTRAQYMAALEAPGEDLPPAEVTIVQEDQTW